MQMTKRMQVFFFFLKVIIRHHFINDRCISIGGTRIKSRLVSRLCKWWIESSCRLFIQRMWKGIRGKDNYLFCIRSSMIGVLALVVLESKVGWYPGCVNGGLNPPAACVYRGW